MSIFAIFRPFCCFQKNFAKSVQYVVQTNRYAKTNTSGFGIKGMKKFKKSGTSTEKIKLPVETDANKLLTYVCGSNIHKEGEDIKLKPDSEYPDWLWNIRTEPIPLEELDKDTKQYWRRLRQIALKRNNRLAKLKKF